ncbi:MAG: 16S rRNA (guanine(527)-N(7))-methyltransferase RsmG [Pseudomonadota bacterium]|nr:16S rRNA (guanine(527)-N(7))-methyltransferase RsmG [Pseudomonadota bacterium]
MSEYDNIWQQQLKIGFVSNSWEINDFQLEQLVAFLNLVYFWNKKHNLTRVKPEDYVSLHVLDSLALKDVVQKKRFLDVGSGAGFPGVPLAIIANPEITVMLDSSQKRCCFLSQVVNELKLERTHIENTNIDCYKPDALFKVVVTRAFASLEKTVKLTQHVLTEDGVLWSMKARLNNSELNAISCWHEVIPVKIKGINSSRCLVKIKPFTTITKR